MFILPGLAWVLRKDLAIGPITIDGWGTLPGVSDVVHDSTVAVLAAIAPFLDSEAASEREPRWLIAWEKAFARSGRVAIPEMSKTGFWLHIMSAAVLSLVMLPVAIPLLNLTTELPARAKCALPFHPGQAHSLHPPSLNPCLP